MEGDTKRKFSPRTLFYLMCATSALILLLIHEFAPPYRVCYNCSKRKDSTPEGVQPGKQEGSGDGAQHVEGCYAYKKGRPGRARRVVNETFQRELGCERRPAKAVIIGVKKCGTETLTATLDLHPGIVANIYPVEDNCSMNLERTMFNRATPMTTPQEIALLNMIGLQYSPDRIAEVVNYLGEDVKVILILRDPVERALSDYRHVTTKLNGVRGKKLTKSIAETVWNHKANEETKGKKKVSYFKDYRITDTFEQSILTSSGTLDESSKLISLGIYNRYVQSVLDQLPDPDNLLVLDGQAFAEKPWKTLQEVEDFLEVSSFFMRKHFKKKGAYYCPKTELRPDADCLRGKGRDKPSVDRKVMKKLARFYEPYNKQLLNLTGMDFPWISDKKI